MRSGMADQSTKQETVFVGAGDVNGNGLDATQSIELSD